MGCEESEWEGYEEGNGGVGVEADYWDAGLGCEGSGHVGELDVGVVYVFDSCDCGAGDQGEEKGGLMPSHSMLLFLSKRHFLSFFCLSLLLGCSCCAARLIAV